MKKALHAGLLSKADVKTRLDQGQIRGKVQCIYSYTTTGFGTMSSYAPVSFHIPICKLPRLDRERPNSTFGLFSDLWDIFLDDADCVADPSMLAIQSSCCDEFNLPVVVR